MSYEKQTHVDGQVLTGDALNHMEDGIAAAHEAAGGKLSKSGHTPNRYLGTDADGNVIEKEAPDSSTESGENANITVDEEMSDESTNPVQNKVVKAYVDGIAGLLPDYGYLKSKKYYALGDSIVDMQGTLTDPETFGDTGYSKDLQNRDISGITVEGYVTAIERRYGLIATNFGKGGHTLVGDFSTLATMDYSDVALVTIAYGVNDARSGVPLGTVNSTDTTTFAGALNQLLRKIYTDNPECRVLVLSPMQRLTVTDFGIATPNANGNYLIDFVNMCKAIAEKRSTAFLDQYRSTGINQTNLCYYTVEGVHPVNQGFARIRNAVIGILDELFELEYEPFGSMTGTGGEEPEEPDTGGDSGGEAPPAEDTEGGSMELTADEFVLDAVVYDGYMPDRNRVGEAAYNASSIEVCTDATELPAGAVYTLTTYLANDSVYAGYIHTTAERQVWDEAQGKYVPNGFGTTWRTNMCTVEEETIDGTSYKKLTYAVDCTKATKYVWFGIKRELVDRASITYV